MSIRKVPRKNGAAYAVRVDMGRTMSGKRDQKQVTCATKAQAERVQAELMAIRDATRGRSGRITLRAYIEVYYRPLMQGLAKSSRDTYEREIRLRIVPALGNIDVRDITRAGIQRMLDSCATEAPARKALGVLKTILNECIADGIIVSNPARLRYRFPPKGRKRDNGLVIGSFASMRPVFSAVAAYPHDEDATCTKLCATGLLMGLRPEERYGLDWSDFDWTRGICYITTAYLPVSKAEGGHDEKGPKTERGLRAVPVPQDAADLLRPLDDGGHFMRDPRGSGRLSPSTAQKRWARFLAWCDQEKLAVPHVTIENMRHSFATSFLAAGGNIENLSRILGHADINTTFRRYVRPTGENLKGDMSRVRL